MIEKERTRKVIINMNIGGDPIVANVPISISEEDARKQWYEGIAKLCQKLGIKTNKN